MFTNVNDCNSEKEPHLCSHLNDNRQAIKHTQQAHAEVKIRGVVTRFLRDKQQTGLVLRLQSARD